MVKKALLSLCVFSSIGLAQDFSSILFLKVLERIYLKNLVQDQ